MSEAEKVALYKFVVKFNQADMISSTKLYGRPTLPLCGNIKREEQSRTFGTWGTYAYKQGLSGII